MAKRGPTGLCYQYIVGPTALRALYNRAYGPTGLIILLNTALRALLRSRLWPKKKPASGQRKKPALAEEAGLHRPKPALSAKSRLLLARKPALLARKAGSFGQKEPAYAGFAGSSFPLGATERSRLEPAKAGSFWPEKSRLTPRPEAGSFWPEKSRLWPEGAGSFRGAHAFVTS